MSSTLSENRRKTSSNLTKNWQIDTTPHILNRIHQQDVNVAVYQRDISVLSRQIEQLLEQHVSIRLQGNKQHITDALFVQLPGDQFAEILSKLII